MTRSGCAAATGGGHALLCKQPHTQRLQLMICGRPRAANAAVWRNGAPGRSAPERDGGRARGGGTDRHQAAPQPLSLRAAPAATAAPETPPPTAPLPNGAPLPCPPLSRIRQSQAADARGSSPPLAPRRAVRTSGARGGGRKRRVRGVLGGGGGGGAAGGECGGRERGGGSAVSPQPGSWGGCGWALCGAWWSQGSALSAAAALYRRWGWAAAAGISAALRVAPAAGLGRTAPPRRPTRRPQPPPALTAALGPGALLAGGAGRGSARAL